MYEWRTGAGRPSEKESRNVARLTTPEIAKKAGVSERSIANVKQAVKADPKAIEKISKGQATATGIIKEHKPAKAKPAKAKPEKPAAVAAIPRTSRGHHKS